MVYLGVEIYVYCQVGLVKKHTTTIFHWNSAKIGMIRTLAVKLNHLFWLVRVQLLFV